MYQQYAGRTPLQRLYGVFLAALNRRRTCQVFDEKLFQLKQAAALQINQVRTSHRIDQSTRATLAQTDRQASRVGSDPINMQ